MKPLILKKPKFYFLTGAILVSVAGLSTILRLSSTSNITLYRALIPFAGLVLLSKNPKGFINFIVLVLFLLIYALFASTVVSRFNRFDIVFYIHFVNIIFFYFIIKEMFLARGALAAYSLLKKIFYITIVLSYIQYFFGGVYFNTQNRLPELNIYFWNGNELAAFLASFLLLYLFHERGTKKFVISALVFFIMIQTGSRLTIITTSLFLLVYLIKTLNIKIDFKLVTFCLFVFLVLIFIFKDYPILNMKVKSFFIEPFEHLLTLDPYYHLGSINTRVNAVIFGMQELVNSFFLGIGPGNSNLMMIEKIIPGTEEWGTYSMHNFIMQIITEWGLVGMIFLSFFLMKAIEIIKSNDRPFLVLIIFLMFTLNITISSGPWSNFFFLSTFYIAFPLLKQEGKLKTDE